MRFPPNPPAFTNREAIVGRLRTASAETPPLDCLIDISETCEHPIRGYVLGDSRTAAEIDRIWHQDDGRIVFEGQTGSDAVRSEKVHIFHTSAHGGPPEMESGLTGLVSEFECHDVTLRFESSVESKRDRQRVITFLLAGPRTYWLNAQWQQVSFRGTVNVRGRIQRPLGRLALPFTIEARPHYLYARSDSRNDREETDLTSRQILSQTHVQSLICTTGESSASYPDRQFLTEAKAAVEDLCLLVSFLSTGLVTWFAHFQAGPGYIERYYRNMARVREYRVDQLDEIVALHDVKQFLPKAFRQLRRLRSRGVDLTLPLTYAFAAGDVRVTSQRFGVLFLGLEAAVAAFERRRSPKRPSPRHYEACKRDLLRALDEFSDKQQGKGITFNKHWWTNKLGDLDRPSFWQRLEPLLSHFRVGWKDLYPRPTKTKPTFIDLRNRLFHASSSTNENDDILKQTLRLQAIFQRILLRWLGWQDLWRAPEPGMRAFLTGSNVLPSGEDAELLRAPTPRKPKT